MNKESLIIRNLGPIHEVQLDDISPLMVLIGESGSGKSTILKVLALFQWIYKMMNIRVYLSMSGVSKSPFRFSWQTYMRNAGFEKYLKPDTEIIYTIGSCVISYKDGKLNTSCAIPQDELSLVKVAFVSDKRNMISNLVAGKAKNNYDFYLDQTYEDFVAATRVIREHSIDYLDVKLTVEKSSNGEKFYISSTNEDEIFKIGFEDASSGMQNVSPLSVNIEYFAHNYDSVTAANKMVFKYLSESDDLKNFSALLNLGEWNKRVINMLIEEPELSLYPESQLKLVDSLVDRCFDEKLQHKMRLAIATHSPYIVNYLNLLAARADSPQNDCETSLPMDKMCVYHVEDGYAYSLKIQSKNGTQIINTRVLSDPISDIYRSYNQIQEQRNGKAVE